MGFAAFLNGGEEAFLNEVTFLKRKTRDFGQKKRRASFGEEARRPFRFFCLKSPIGTAEGVHI
ncbi:MAG: hypothetical protein AB7D39_09140 [Pseudodesulfovibrio sp.]|uniref:hypothetical protein n=1 Tax=Pseudodesulfovibrio sp. TaxID=2035812 RepID=UPI003D0E6C23